MFKNYVLSVARRKWRQRAESISVFTIQRFYSITQ